MEITKMPTFTDSYVSREDKKIIDKFKETYDILKSMVEGQNEIIRKLKEIERKRSDAIR